MGDLLIRRRLENIAQLIEEYKLLVKVLLVPSQENKADKLTRFPKSIEKLIAADTQVEEVVQAVHERIHFGEKRTTHLAAEAIKLDVGKGIIKKVVEDCDVSSRIDPKLKFSTTTRSITASRVNERWCINIAPIKGKPFLSITLVVIFFIFTHP